MTASSSSAQTITVTMATTLADVSTNMTSSWPDVNSSVTAAMMTPPEGCLAFNFSVFAPWANPEDLVTRETQQKFAKFVNVYLLTLLFFICIPTNLLNMIIYWQQGLKERINLCLFSLSFADLVTVLGHFEWNLDGLYAEITGTPPKLVVMKFNVNNMIHNLAAFIYISGFLSLLIAFERFLCVVFPLKAQIFLRTRTTLIIIVVAHVVILTSHYFIATKWRVVCMFDSVIGQTTDAFYSGDFYLKNKFVVDLIDSLVFGILIPGVCVVGVLVFTVIIVTKLRQMAQWRNQTTSSTATTNNNNKTTSNVKDVALTRMLIGASVLYLVCTFPPLVFHAALPAVPELSLGGKLYNTYSLCINLQQLFTYVNASVNFFVYYVFGTKFRCGVQKLFCWRRWKKRGSGTAEKSAIHSASTGISTVSYSLPSVSDLTDVAFGTKSSLNDIASGTQSEKLTRK